MDLEAHRGFLKGIAYRMTGTVSDADDVVQEAFARTLAHPPPDRSRPLRPWLVRVTMNVARDKLRHRRRRGYEGPWLPGVADDDAIAAIVDDDALGAEARYSRKESVTFAFLVALEALTPLQRAVLVLREVFDFSGRETADALGLTEDNAKQLLSRAKKALRAYDVRRSVVDDDRVARDTATLHRFLTALATDDTATALSMLRDDVIGMTDGGPFRAAKVLLEGPMRIVTVLRGLMKQWPPEAFAIETAIINAQPAVIMTAHTPREHYAPRWVLRIDTDDTGLIVGLHSLGAPDKLTVVDTLLAG